VPQSPTNLARGHSGDLWITSESNNEKGAWRWPAAGNLLHIAGQSADNNLGDDVNMLVKSELAGKDVTYAVDDSAGNTWYATYAHGVLVQKADNSWVTFSTTEAGTRALADNQIRHIRFTTADWYLLEQRPDPGCDAGQRWKLVGADQSRTPSRQQSAEYGACLHALQRRLQCAGE
jgi:hypothetical protein